MDQTGANGSTLFYHLIQLHNRLAIIAKKKIVDYNNIIQTFVVLRNHVAIFRN
jgi:hypothetical protein